MAEQVVDEKSDDLDIVSTGNLYQGPWEKKYWSSSRGKDRHPYPVGYVAQRTYNGNTYKMAILEGLKGPEFAISSTDGESCSGQTPDIAWEGFQKKSCVRIKFWRGKRYSCKIDGAELFGFKNPLVARLLRGLKANSSPIAEHSLPSSGIGNEQFKGTRVHHTQLTLHSGERCKDPDLETKLVKTEGKEKRSKKRKEVDVKSVSGTRHKTERPQDSTQSGHGNHIIGIPFHSSNLNEDNGNDKSHLSLTEDGLQFDSFTSSKNLEKDRCPAVPPLQKGSQMMDNVDLYAPDTLDPALEDEKGDRRAKKDSQMLDDVDLCAPDTSDSTLDSTCNQDLEISKESSCCINDKLSPPEKCVTESQSKDEMVINTGSDNSYKSDSDSLGQEITNSMMTLLLPRALPLLKTYSRKKKKNVNIMSHEDKKGNSHQYVEEDSTAIAPDSFENHQCEPQNTCGTATKMVHNDEEAKDGSNLQNVFELVGCYVHPTPISIMILRTKGNEVFICVLCGYLMEKDRTMFVYKTSIKVETKGHPSFIGHTKIISPVSKNTSGDQIIQFTPDGECLVLLNNINAPYCREGGVNCKFSACTPDSFEKNAVKIVQVKLGYVHVVCKLKTTGDVCCILVCEPSFLLAADESGKVNLWTMNPTWSAETEHSYLPTSDRMPNSVIEMKRIPNFPSLVIGHTAFGDFCLWDVTRKILVSKFSAPGTSFHPFLPINLFKCPKKKQVADMMKETHTQTQTQTQRWTLETDNHEDVTLVLLVSDIDSGYWSLALMAKHKLVLLNALDPSTRVAGASAGYGIIDTSDGSMSIWELSSGTNLGYLSHCRGATVSCLATDNTSDSGVFAVDVDGSQLQVYAKKHRVSKGIFHTPK